MQQLIFFFTIFKTLSQWEESRRKDGIKDIHQRITQQWHERRRFLITTLPLDCPLMTSTGTITWKVPRKLYPWSAQLSDLSCLSDIIRHAERSLTSSISLPNQVVRLYGMWYYSLFEVYKIFTSVIFLTCPCCSTVGICAPLQMQAKSYRSTLWTLCL